MSAVKRRFFMALTKAQKQKIVEDLTQNLSRQKSLVFVDFKGLKVKDMAALRKKIKKVGGLLKVAKKTLIKLASEKAGLKLEKELEGEIGLVFAFEDPISSLRAAYQFSQSNNLKILDGIFEGKFLERENIITLAQLPTREELLVSVVGSISAPISRLVNVLQGNLRSLVFVLSAIKK